MARRTRQIQIEGMAELTQQINRLRSTAVGADVQAALLRAAEEIRSDAERRAPVAPYPTRQGGKTYQPGGLKRSLKAAAGRKYKTFLQAFTFTLAEAAPHAHLVQFGTKPHTIAGKKMRIAGRAFAWLSRVGDQIRTKVQHPGSKPNPFFTDAIRAKRAQVRLLIEAEVKKAFDALARTA